jgi:hypothetical protein
MVLSSKVLFAPTRLINCYADDYAEVLLTIEMDGNQTPAFMHDSQYGPNP